MTPTLALCRPRYAVTDLGSLGGVECAANAINNRGQIVGGADTSKHTKGPEFLTNVFVWQNGRMRAVPGLDGSHAFVVAVNDAGQMAGAYSPDPLKAQFAAAQFTLGGPRASAGRLPGHDARLSRCPRRRPSTLKGSASAFPTTKRFSGTGSACGSCRRRPAFRPPTPVP